MRFVMFILRLVVGVIALAITLTSAFELYAAIHPNGLSSSKALRLGVLLGGFISSSLILAWTWKNEGRALICSLIVLMLVGVPTTLQYIDLVVNPPEPALGFRDEGTERTSLLGPPTESEHQADIDFRKTILIVPLAAILFQTAALVLLWRFSSWKAARNSAAVFE